MMRSLPVARRGSTRAWPCAGTSRLTLPSNWSRWSSRCSALRVASWSIHSPPTRWGAHGKLFTWLLHFSIESKLQTYVDTPWSQSSNCADCSCFIYFFSVVWNGIVVGKHKGTLEVSLNCIWSRLLLVCCGTLSISQTQRQVVFDTCGVFYALNLWKDKICMYIEGYNAVKLRNKFYLIMINEVSFGHHSF